MKIQARMLQSKYLKNKARYEKALSGFVSYVKAFSNEKRTFFVVIAKHPNCGQP